MLINMAFKRVVDFHGHLCPDLVLGGKFCEYVRKLMLSSPEFYCGLSIVAENCTSALDAIQIMLGTTVGNQRLMVMDFGKHNYTVLLKHIQTGYRLSLKQQQYADEEQYSQLEQKIIDHPGKLEAVVEFQKILDGRIKFLLNLSPEELFMKKTIEPARLPAESVGVYRICCKCGEQVLKNRIIDYRGQIYCMPCFQRSNSGCVRHSLQ